MVTDYRGYSQTFLSDLISACGVLYEPAASRKINSELRLLSPTAPHQRRWGWPWYSWASWSMVARWEEGRNLLQSSNVSSKSTTTRFTSASPSDTSHVTKQWQTSLCNSRGTWKGCSVAADYVPLNIEELLRVPLVQCISVLHVIFVDRPRHPTLLSVWEINVKALCALSILTQIVRHTAHPGV